MACRARSRFTRAIRFPALDDDPAVGRGEVLLRGQRAPMVGRISMDLTLLDVTHIPGAVDWR